MAPKPDVSEERTEQILDAALTVFSRRGIDRARMTDVGDEAGLSKATLYLYFKSKDALVGAIVRRLFERELRSFQELEVSDVSTREVLVDFGERIVEDLHRMRPLLPLLYEFYAMGLRKPAVRDVLGEFVRHFVDLLVPVIRRGVDRGELRPVDPERTAVALGAILEGTLLLWAYAPDRVELEEQIRFDVLALLDGLGASATGV